MQASSVVRVQDFMSASFSMIYRGLLQLEIVGIDVDIPALRLLNELLQTPTVCLSSLALSNALTLGREDDANDLHAQAKWLPVLSGFFASLPSSLVYLELDNNVLGRYVGS